MPHIEPREGVPRVEPTIFTIGGIVTYVYGDIEKLDPLEPLPLLIIAHPRELNYKYGQTLAQEFVHQVSNLISVTFDLPNHGSRLVSDLRNKDWKDNNPTHAQDMCSIIEAGASEAAMIARYIPWYIPKLLEAKNAGNLIPLVTGASLGGHISWQVAYGPDGPLGSGYFRGAAPIIGNFNVPALLANRFVRSQLSQSQAQPTELGPLPLKPLYKEVAKTKNFHVLMQYGGNDRLVPADETKEFIPLVKGNDNFKIIVQDGIGHWSSPEMIDNVAAWIEESKHWS